MAGGLLHVRCAVLGDLISLRETRGPEGFFRFAGDRAAIIDDSKKSARPQLVAQGVYLATPDLSPAQLFL